MKQGIDQRLIANCIANQRAAQRRLYELTVPYFTVIARRYLRNPEDLKDTLQDSYLNIFHKLEQFDPARAGFKTWATRVLINNCLKRNTSGQKNATEELIVERNQKSTSPGVIEKLSTDELIVWLKRMPEAYYAVFSLNVIDGFSHPEIAGMLNIDAALSRKRLSRARAWLKQEMVRDPKSPLRDDPRFRREMMSIQAFVLVQAFIYGLPEV